MTEAHKNEQENPALWDKLEWVLGLEDSNYSGSDEGREIGRKISKSIRAQSLTGIVLALGLYFISPVAAYSSLFGSLAAFIPTVLFAVMVATKIGNDSAVFLRAAVIGEGTKLLLTAVICIAVFLWVKPLAAGWFFAGMIATIFVGYLGLIFGD